MKNEAIEDQLIEAAVDTIKETRDTSMFKPFKSGDAEVDGAMAEAKLTSTAEDRAIIYHIATGEPREILVNMLAKTLRKRENGKPVFSMTPPPGKTPFLGESLCWLHPDHPERQAFDSMGLRDKVCMSAHLASEYDAGQHMQRRHRREYRVIVETRATQREEETRIFQRQQMELLQKLASKAVGSDGGSVPEIFYCKTEGCTRFFDNAKALDVHMTRDHK